MSYQLIAQFMSAFPETLVEAPDVRFHTVVSTRTLAWHSTRWS